MLRVVAGWFKVIVIGELKHIFSTDWHGCCSASTLGLDTNKAPPTPISWGQ